METSTKKILVVDDDFFFHYEFEPILAAQGYRVMGAPDGARGLALITETPPDLVILDINMPGMTGFDVLEKMRKDPQKKAIPVIMVSGDGHLDNILAAQNFDVSDFLIKPVPREEMLCVVKRHL